MIACIGIAAMMIMAAQPSPTPPAASPTPQSSSAHSLAPIVVNGQVVDFERGYIVFASGDAFATTPDTHVVDDATGASPRYAIEPGMYAAASLDPSTALVIAIRFSSRPLTAGTAAARIDRRLVAAASPQQANPDLEPPRVAYPTTLSSDVLVTIAVEVPPDTPYTDDIFVTTDSSGWNAQAIKMQRVDGRRFRIQIHLKGGAEFHYLFTRGSWQSVERDHSGLQRSPRLLAVPGGDSMVVSLTVYRWADLP